MRFVDRIKSAWLPRPVDIQAEPTVRNSGLGSFPYSSNAENAAKILKRQRDAMAKTFHRGIESLTPSIDGQAAPDYALDDSYQDLTSAKLQNARGGWLPIQQLEWYGSQGFIGWQLCAMLSQNWLIDKACGVPASDAIRNGYDILFDDGQKVDPDVLSAIYRADKRMGVRNQCKEFVKKSRIFGVRVALFLIDGIDYEAPFNPDGIRPGSYKGITQIDPYWIAPELDRSAAANPAAKDFYEPTWWLINSKRVHKSHFVITRPGGTMVDLLAPSYYYGGLPIPQRIYSRVYAAERTADEAPMLAMTKRMMVLKADVTKWFGPDGIANANMQEWVDMMNNFSLKVIGTDEDAQQFETSLTGLDETIMTQFQLVAAASNVPATKLLGTSPKGFNATGEYDEASYHEELESIQEESCTPFIERHHLCLWRSQIAPKFGLDPKRGLEINWRPTDSMTAKEEAEVNEIKSRAAANYVASGAIDGLDVRRNLIADPESGFTGMEEIVPDGPGDREAELAMTEALLQRPNPDSAMDSASAAGIMYRAGTRFLLMKRRDERENGGLWSWPAGSVESGESVMQAACREFAEETGRKIYRASPAWADDNFALFCTYGEEFVPRLDEEHSAYVWASVADLPSPLHPGVTEQIEAATGESVIGIASVEG